MQQMDADRHSTPARPDTRDWTFVTAERCPECGFTPGEAHNTVPTRLHDAVARWGVVLQRPDAVIRPEPDVWSALEYGCHVAELSEVFTGRIEAMRTQDRPTFADWDGEQAAIDGDYNARNPAAVAANLARALTQAAGLFADLDPADWSRPGRRGDGHEFTIDSLSDYWLHEVQHHLHDVHG